MGIKEILSKIKRGLTGRDEPQREYEDDETRDNYLRSLRREKRVQGEEVEKERLKKEIEEYKKQRRREILYGVGEDAKRLVRPSPAEKRIARILRKRIAAPFKAVEKELKSEPSPKTLKRRQKIAMRLEGLRAIKRKKVKKKKLKGMTRQEIEALIRKIQTGKAQERQSSGFFIPTSELEQRKEKIKEQINLLRKKKSLIEKEKKEEKQASPTSSWFEKSDL